MNPRMLTVEVSASSQLLASDMVAVAAAGYKSVICNRPDGEASDQPTFAEIESAGAAVGIEVRYLPVVPGNVTDVAADTFRQMINELPKPVLAFCRTGVRAASLWALSRPERLSQDEIIETARAVGFELDPLKQRIKERGAASI